MSKKYVIQYNETFQKLYDNGERWIKENPTKHPSFSEDGIPSNNDAMEMLISMASNTDGDTTLNITFEMFKLVIYHLLNRKERIEKVFNTG